MKPKLLFKSQIDGEFNGFEGESIYKLVNGQIWQQDEYYYEYSFDYMPNVYIYDDVLGGFKMKVDGIEQMIGVKRLK